jgi:hypothetical protein
MHRSVNPASCQKSSDCQAIATIVPGTCQDQNRPPDASLLDSVTGTPRSILHQQQGRNPQFRDSILIHTATFST